LSTTVSQYRQVAEVFKRVADFAWIADVDRKPLAARNHFPDVIPADGGRDDRLNVANGQPISCCRLPVDVDVDVPAAVKPLC
jgi:hypothetical protein